jgi:uncharacterized Ntn-hydrolase superfamily protein
VPIVGDFVQHFAVLGAKRFVILTLLVASPAGATYSIVAADAASRQVGGAVTSCVAPQSVEVVYRGAPGHGAIHAQAAANANGRDRGVVLLQSGTAPAEVIAQIANSSFDSQFQRRQYGVVDLSGRAAGFTGTSAQQYRADRQGSVGAYVYSVQGNILTGVAVLDQAEAGFKSKGCDLAERLMLALEAGAQNGQGDSRCTTAYGIPSDAASLQVDREGEPAGSYLRLVFTSTSLVHESPIVRLRAQYNAWRTTHPCPSSSDGGADDTDASAGGASGGGGLTGSGGLGSGGLGSGGLGGASSGGASSGGAAAGGGPGGGAPSGGTGAVPGSGGSAGGASVGSGGVSAGAPNTGGPAPAADDGGCGCRVHQRTEHWSILAVAAAWMWITRRRANRKARQAPAP